MAEPGEALFRSLWRGAKSVIKGGYSGWKGKSQLITPRDKTQKSEKLSKCNNVINKH